MNNIEKLFRKICKKDRTALLCLVDELLSGRKVGNARKLQDSDFYKIRKGNFRIIFHYEFGKSVVIDSIRLRNEKTYKGF